MTELYIAYAEYLDRMYEATPDLAVLDDYEIRNEKLEEFIEFID